MQIPNNYYLGDGPRLTLKQLLLMNGPANSQLIKLPEFKAASRQRNGYLLLCDAMGKWTFLISTLILYLQLERRIKHPCTLPAVVCPFMDCGR